MALCKRPVIVVIERLGIDTQVPEKGFCCWAIVTGRVNRLTAAIPNQFTVAYRELIAFGVTAKIIVIF